jgi:hypothetical protein
MLLNEHGANDVRQTYMQTSEPLVTEPNASEVEVATEKVKSHKSPGIDQISAGLTKVGSRKIRSEINKRVISVSNKEELPK